MSRTSSLSTFSWGERRLFDYFLNFKVTRRFPIVSSGLSAVWPARLSSWPTGGTCCSCARARGSATSSKRSTDLLNQSDSPLLIHCASRFIYPGIASVFIASLYFPKGVGQYFLTSLTPRQQIINLFANFTFLSEDLTEKQAHIVSLWGEDPSTLFTTLGIYMLAAVSRGLSFQISY